MNISPEKKHNCPISIWEDIQFSWEIQLKFIVRNYFIPGRSTIIFLMVFLWKVAYIMILFRIWALRIDFTVWTSCLVLLLEPHPNPRSTEYILFYYVKMFMIVFVWEPHLAILRGFSWLSAQKSLLTLLQGC